MLQITDGEFNVLRGIMYEATGVRLTDAKKQLAMFRLRKRVVELKIKRFSDYLKLIKDPKALELEIFINAITTNQTFFYRHPQQFERLVTQILPDLLKRKKEEKTREIRIWSAAASTGEEPYSIAIACKIFFQMYPDYKFTVYASDINSNVLDFSKKAIYEERSIDGMPGHLKKLFFSPVEVETKKKRKFYRLQPAIAKSVQFLHHNLMKPFPYKNFDIIFLRNVMIYFDRKSKQKTIQLLEEKLNDGGYFFISLTETLSGLNCNLKHVGDCIYQKCG